MKNYKDVEMNEIVDRENLAVVYEVEKLEPIPNKDKIELVHLKNCGYTAICQKIHKVGDLVVFVKFDTEVPNNELFSFMKDFKFKVKSKSFTVKNDKDEVIDKIYSQGIVLRVEDVENFIGRKVNVGEDLTKVLKVKKHINVVNSGGAFGPVEFEGDFPTYLLPITDEINICVNVNVLEEIKGKDVYITQKIDGSSVTFLIDPKSNEMTVCSRNKKHRKIEGNKLWEIVYKYDIEKKLRTMPWVAIQGELYGEKIQKNMLNIKNIDIAVFNMVDLRDKRRLSLYEMQEICEKELPMVQVVEVIKNFNWSFEKLQNFADEQKYPSGNVCEGVVLRPIEPFFSVELKNWWSVKILNRNYKL